MTVTVGTGAAAAAAAATGVAAATAAAATAAGVAVVSAAAAAAAAVTVGRTTGRTVTVRRFSTPFLFPFTAVFPFFLRFFTVQSKHEIRFLDNNILQ